MPNSFTTDDNLLSVVNGYSDAVKHRQQLEKSGSDFSESKGEVANTIAQLHPRRLQLQVVEIIVETASTKTLRVKSLSKALPPFQAGQYINLFINIDGVDTARPYAISSSPSCRDHYDLTVKRLDSGYVSHFLLDRIQAGDHLQSTGPMGTFHYNPIFHGDNLVFLAGGSGIAPARSMIEAFAAENSGKQLHILYSSSYQDDVIFDQELDTLTAANDFLKVSRFISRANDAAEKISGRISQQDIQALVDDIDSAMFYICGPTSFNQACETMLAQLQVKARRIRIECNGPPSRPQDRANWPAAVDSQQSVEITIQGRGSFIASSNEPLLNSLERNGYSAENACRSGECSLCRVKVVKGSVYNPSEARLRKSDAQYGWCHSCVAFPLEDLETIL